MSSLEYEQQREVLSDEIRTFLYSDKAKALAAANLKLDLAKENDDPNEISLAYLNIGTVHSKHGEFEDATFNYQEAQAIAVKHENLLNEAKAITKLGHVQFSQAHYKNAIPYFEQAKDLYTEINDLDGVSKCINSLGTSSMKLGEFPEAIDRFFEGLAIDESLNDSAGIASYYANIGAVYYYQTDIPNATKYSKKALEIKERLGRNTKLVGAYINLGAMYNAMLKEDSAMIYYHKGLALSNELQYKNGQAISLTTLGKIHVSKGDYAIAEEYLNEALKLQIEVNDIANIVYTYRELGYLYQMQGKYEASEKALMEAESRAIKDDMLLELQDVYGSMSELYRETANYKLALDYYVLYSEVADSIINMEVQEASVKAEMKFEFDKERLADSLAHAHKEATANLELSEQQAISDKLALEGDAYEQQENYYIIGGVLLLIVIGLILFSLMQKKKDNRLILAQKDQVEIQKKEIEHQHETLEDQHKEITDSINYAKRIQTALLTEDAEWERISKDHFVLFKPKDVVSGDFFWAYHNDDSQLSIWVAADCTGHGVPGAFMSMLGIGFLNEIVSESGITKPDEILNILRDKIINSLVQKNVDTQQKDGMDIALCVWDRKANNLSFAGANNPLWIIRDSSLLTQEQKNHPKTVQSDGLSLLEIKPDKMPVGYMGDNMPKFSSVEIPLHKGDVIYSFTDGFADQFGGERGKKFKYKPFKQLILDKQSIAMKDQKELLDTTFENWKGDLEQIDDVCIIGVKVC